MTLIWIIVLGLLIGAVLGGLGGGGAILTVPALVYVIGQRAQDATTSSLVIVGLTAVVGVFSYVASRRVRWKTGLVFGIVGIPATWLGSFLNHRVDENLLLLGFSALMVIAAAAMFGDRAEPASGADPAGRSAPTSAAAGTRTPPWGPVAVMERTSTDTESGTRPAVLIVIATALAVGSLTGFFGVGGGFVIVPALVLVLRLPMQQAVGTSLMIVALNSGTSLAARAGTAHFDWSVIVPFTIAAMAATLAGKQVADRLPARKLKLGFAALLVLVAGYTAWQSIDGLTGSEPVETSSATRASSSAIAEPADVEAADVVAALAAGSIAVDVRTPEEFAAGHVDGAFHVDLSSAPFDTEISKLDRDQAYVVYCASGNRASTTIDRTLSQSRTSLTKYRSCRPT